MCYFFLPAYGWGSAPNDGTVFFFTQEVRHQTSLYSRKTKKINYPEYPGHCILVSTVIAAVPDLAGLFSTVKTTALIRLFSSVIAAVLYLSRSVSTILTAVDNLGFILFSAVIAAFPDLARLFSTFTAAAPILLDWFQQ